MNLRLKSSKKLGVSFFLEQGAMQRLSEIAEEQLLDRDLPEVATILAFAQPQSDAGCFGVGILANAMP